MHASLEIIESISIILLVAGVFGALFSFIRLPGILAFILAGMLIGPGGLGWVSNTDIITAIANLGIILLLFVLGAELSLPRLKEMRVHALWAGVIQLMLTNAVLSLVFMAFGLSFKTAVFLGGALALSSTALVLKILGDYGELETAHGRIAMGILLVQDLALVPLMSFMPILTGSGGQESMWLSLLWVLLKVAFFLGIIVVMSWQFVPRVIDKIAAVSSKEIFVIVVVAFGLIIALVAEKMGLSYAVGAFVAGLTLSRSVTSRQIIADSMPIRDIFSAVFFVSVGMLLNTRFVWEHSVLTLGVTGLIVLIKAITVALSVYLLRFPVKTTLWCGLSLFQVGEFSFILFQTGLQAGTINATILQTVTSAIVFSMLMTPLVIRGIPSLMRWIEAQPHLLKKIDLNLAKQRIQPLKDEVVIAGYGPIAKNLAQVLQSHEIGFRIIEMNINTVKRLQNQGIHAVFGDASNAEVLQHANLQEAKVFAITIPDIRAVELAIQNAKRINPNIYCIARSRYQHPIPILFQLGTDEVVYEEFETSMSFIYSILDVFGDVVTDRESYMLLLRENRRALLRTGKPIEDQTRYGRLSVFKETKIEWIAIPENSPLVGMTLAQAELRQRTGVNVLSIVEPDGINQITPEPDVVLRGNQVLVVIGTLEQLSALEALMC